MGSGLMLHRDGDSVVPPVPSMVPGRYIGGPSKYPRLHGCEVALHCA